MGTPTAPVPSTPEPHVGAQVAQLPPPRRRDRDLPLAIASGLALVALLFGTLYLHPFAFVAFVCVLVVVGVAETGAVLRRRGTPVAVPVVVVGGLVTIVAAYFSGHAGQALGIGVTFLGAAAWELADDRRHQVVQRMAATLLLTVWVPFLASFAALLVRAPDYGWVLVIATVGTAAFSDVGAYAVGTRFGRRKMAPSISPGKTWEGVVGGVGIAAVLAALVLPHLGPSGVFAPWSAAVFVVVVSIACVVGDLTESMVKRDLGIKDFGALIPGHGGILDRVDGVLLALPTGYFALVLLLS